MPKIPSHLQPKQRPLAAPEAVVTAGNARFTVLTPRLLRLEYAPNGRFEDRASQAFWHRQQSVPPFTVTETAVTLTLETAHLRLTYRRDPGDFTPASLAITLLDEDITWYPGEPNPGNLRGTTRTLDEVSGATHLEPGLLSRQGWVVVDDSHSLVFGDDGWVTPRQAAPAARDWYFFGYGRAFQECLRDFQKIAGPVPLLPRWALGSWWSRYWAYTADELVQLMDDFRAHEVPLSVCIIDMDWHLVNIGREYDDLIGYGTGWTGYTWNRDLFPEPRAFLSRLRRRGMRMALNLHPADGVRPHEAMYPQMARRMGIDPRSKAPVRFDIADPRFALAYFELLHHPHEARGVDFWWIDWQQGTRSSLPGLDPLWWLNHLHFHDLARDGRKRPFIFSRWGGLGNHRYPIGFSGDTHVDWPTLAFQPYFTATAANVGYGWWSHDIGGHMKGIEDAELYARWVQFGTFSPILRLHSSKNPFHERRPWGYDAETLRVARDAMQLRHALIPYLYTHSWLNHSEGTAPVRPMYHDYPQHDAAYVCPQQYSFGSELIAAPFTAPANPDTRLSRQVVWLPPGDWYDFFSGEYFAGDSWHAVYGRLERIPVFARAGAIVPLGPREGWGGIANPDKLHVHVFAGADNRFVLYEDDGETTAYTRGEFSLTAFVQTWRANSLEFSVSAVAADSSHVPEPRHFQLHIHGIINPTAIELTVNGAPHLCTCTYDTATETLHVSGIALSRQQALRLSLSAAGATLLSRRDRTVETATRMLESFRLHTTAKAGVAHILPALRRHPALLTNFAVDMTSAQQRALLEVTQQAGVQHVRAQGRPHLLVLWNNHERPGMDFRMAWNVSENWDPATRFRAESGSVPRFMALEPADGAWQLAVDYFGVVETAVFPDADQAAETT